MNRVFCGFSDYEYEKIQNKANELEMSISKLVEYAATVFVNAPRKQVPNLQKIQERIQNFIKREDVNEFICSDPFDNWLEMTTGEKRTAAAQLRKLVDSGLIEKVNPESKSHRATVYKKVKEEIKNAKKKS